jgi:hypothetical protein
MHLTVIPCLRQAGEGVARVVMVATEGIHSACLPLAGEKSYFF